MSERANDLYLALRKTVLLAAAVLMLLWFLYQIRDILLLFLFAGSLAVMINWPVTWLADKGFPRIPALLLVLLLILVVVSLFAWFLIPRLAADASTLAGNLPGYLSSLRDRYLAFLDQYPALAQNLGLDGSSITLPSVSTILGPLGRYSVSLLGWAAIIIFLVSVVVYMVAYPLPLLETYLHLLPPRWRRPGTRAFVDASEMITGWLRANLIAGGIEAVAVSIALTFLGVPSALIWGALAFFAELVPRLGLYLMALPPLLVALSVDPLKALWVLLFYIALNETMGNLVLPRLQKQTMDLHPVLILFAVLALAAAFGLVGALLAVPLAAIVRAYYEAFYLERQAPDPALDSRVQQMLHAELSGTDGAPAEAES